jgi:hypothetical protein
MASFKTFVGKTEENGHLARLCADVSCRNFKEARTRAVAAYKEKRAAATELVACVLCDEHAAFVGAGIRPDCIRNFGNGYCVDVTPSLAAPAPTTFEHLTAL